MKTLTKGLPVAAALLLAICGGCSRKAQQVLFVAAVAALASCTPLADVRETNGGESVFVALPEN